MVFFACFTLIFAEQAHGFALFSATIAFMLFLFFYVRLVYRYAKIKRAFGGRIFTLAATFDVCDELFISYAANLPMLNFDYEYSHLHRRRVCFGGGFV